MGSSYEALEPAVIDDDLLLKAIEEQGPKNEAGRLAKEDGVNWKEIKQIRLDFRNILRIENLWCLTNLTKLQLDNNVIEVIEGLNHLVNLVWLDLSFNHIEVIEGLAELTKLQDLSLYNNKIKRIQGLDTLTQLQLFSIGKNDLHNLSNVLYLRFFPNLKTLNLAGNPICQQPDYKAYVLAHLPNLRFLDYRRVDPEFRTEVSKNYEISLLELESNELAKRTQDEEDDLEEKKRKHHEAAQVTGLDGTKFFDSLFEGNKDGVTLSQARGAEEFHAEFKLRFCETSQSMYECGLKMLEERKEELALFWECVNEAKDDNKKESMDKIKDFLAYKEHLWHDLATSDLTNIESQVTEYNQLVDKLWTSLMANEVLLVDQLEEVIKEFQRNLTDMVNNWIENVRGFMTHIRELENIYMERLTDFAMICLDNKNDIDDLSDDFKDLLVYKDTLLSALQSIHDFHMIKIDTKEDSIQSSVNNWKDTLMFEIHEQQEVMRNRSRVSEISHFIQHLKDEMDFIAGNALS